jgi:hypothetical protein
MVDTRYEANFLNDVLPRLKDYVMQDELFWPVNAAGSPPYPKLTLGNALYFLARLRGKDSSAAESFEAKLKEIKNEWRTHWQGKAAQEYVSRLRQWASYIEELKKDFRAHAPYYDSEVRVRALLELLAKDLRGGKLPPEADLLPVLDSALWSHLLEGAFMWSEDLQGAFPQKDYWFLYGYLQG